MTRFIDGPAQGVNLNLTRAPLFLRVVNQNGKWDALDQLEDSPAAGELVYVYRRHGKPSVVFVDGRDPVTGKRIGAQYVSCDYRFYENQPAIDAIVRNNDQWQRWVMEVIRENRDAPYGTE